MKYQRPAFCTNDERSRWLCSPLPSCQRAVKVDEGVLRLAAQHFGAFHFKTQPGALGAPVS